MMHAKRFRQATATAVAIGPELTASPVLQTKLLQIRQHLPLMLVQKWWSLWEVDHLALLP